MLDFATRWWPVSGNKDCFSSFRRISFHLEPDSSTVIATVAPEWGHWKEERWTPGRSRRSPRHCTWLHRPRRARSGQTLPDHFTSLSRRWDQAMIWRPLEVFEGRAEACGWPQVQGGPPLLTGDALTMAQSVHVATRTSYGDPKLAILDHIGLTLEGHHRRFQGLRLEDSSRHMAYWVLECLDCLKTLGHLWTDAPQWPAGRLPPARNPLVYYSVFMSTCSFILV